MKKILLGAHVSISGGLEKAIVRGEKIGCTTIQIFLTSSRSWTTKKLTPEEINLFKETQKKSSIEVVVAHCSYLINIAAKEKSTELKSVKALTQEFERCNLLGIPYLVLHPGSHVGAGEAAGIEKVAKNLDEVLEEIPLAPIRLRPKGLHSGRTEDEQHHGNTMILLEIMSGQGTNLGYTFEQLKEIRNECKHKNKIGICFDTCHAFSAGYDISNDYEDTWKKFDQILGLKNLKVIHLNGSKTELGSKKDRHENIGKGTIPLKTFELIMNDKRFAVIPKILETPEEKELGDNYEKEIKLLKKLVKE